MSFVLFRVCVVGVYYVPVLMASASCVAVFVNWETSNRYVIKNSLGQQVFFASEESDTCHRQCCGPGRGFIMHITDNLGQVSSYKNSIF